MAEKRGMSAGQWVGTAIFASVVILFVRHEIKKGQSLQLGKSKGFDPNEWVKAVAKKIARSKFLTSSNSVKLAKQIHDSIGVVYDDESNIMSALRQTKNLLQVSQVAWQYNQLYKEDLFTTLYKNLSDSEMAIVGEIIKKLPYS